MELHVQQWGEHGPRVLLVHGSVLNGEMTWSRQRPLAESFRLLVMDRRGHFPNPEIESPDAGVDADDVAALLEPGTHLVGHSYGGVISMLAATRRSQAVRSLTVIEPPAFGVARDDPRVGARLMQLEQLWATHAGGSPESFLAKFLELLDSDASASRQLSPAVSQNVRVLMAEKDPARLSLDYESLKRAPFPKLVVSGAHSSVYDTICDRVVGLLGAQRVVIEGGGHNPQRKGARFNAVLRAFIDSAESGAVI
jgi:pimeloyl-ACP methyl ester carboxylesterase